MSNFSLRIFLNYIDIDMVHYSLALIYFLGCKCRGGVFKCLWEFELMRGPLPGADPEIFQRGGGGLRRKILKKKMFVDTLINACTHKNYIDMQLFLSSSFSKALF